MPSHAVGSRPLDSARLVITSISWVSRIEDAKESLLRSRWDLVIVDEAHKMAAYSADKKTLAYKLGEALSTMTDHYLLMTATPHKGDPENFCLFLELLDRDIYGSVESLEEAMRRHHAPLSSPHQGGTGFVPRSRHWRGEETLHEARGPHGLFRVGWRRVRFLRRAHPVRRGPVHQGFGGRQRPRPRSLLHNGDAPTPLRI